MSKPLAATLLIVVMVVVIVVVDVLFLSGRFGLRLAVNVGIVVVAITVYYKFLRH